MTKKSHPKKDVVGDLQNINTFKMSTYVLQEMVNHCQYSLPYEACGLVSGKNGIVITIWKMKNHARSTTSFSMDTAEIGAVFESIKIRGEKLLGIYHSHPTDWAYPSYTDIALNNYPELSHLIISLANKHPTLNCFRIVGNTIKQMNIQMID